jgi:hypothetical protein
MRQDNLHLQSKIQEYREAVSVMRQAYDALNMGNEEDLYE